MGLRAYVSKLRLYIAFQVRGYGSAVSILAVTFIKTLVL